MNELFDNLPDGMTAHIDEASKTIYIHDVPHSLIDCLDYLVSGWRDVVYVSPDDAFEKARHNPIARQALIQPLFAILASAQMNGFDMVVFHPERLAIGIPVYRDAEGNIRPTLGFDPVKVTAIQRPVIGFSLGTDETGQTRVMMQGTFTVSAPKLPIYLQPPDDEDDSGD